MDDPKPDDWLPAGWRVEVNVRGNGKKDKFYLNQAKGLQFYSKAEVIHYLSVKNPNSEAMNKSSPKQSAKNVVVEKDVTEGLPPGWIKEIKITKSGRKVRKDPYFIDPIKGHVFRSLKSAQRYVETREGGTNTLKSKDQSNDDEELKDDNISVVVEKDVARGLPPGWIKEIKITKSDRKVRKDPYFIDPIEGHVFRSLKSAQRYVESREVGRNADQSNDDEELKDDNISVGVEKDVAEGLPPGWIKEIKTTKSARKFRKDSYFIDPIKGHVFRSLKSAQRYVETKEVGRNTLKSEDQSNDDEELKDDNISSVVVEKDVAEGLPSGWIKEIKITKSAGKFRKDPYFIDPIKGYAFRSLKSAQRYVETREVGRNALKSKDQSSDDEELKDDNISSVVVEKDVAEGLPPGWIKEIKITKSAGKFRKDPNFVDPIKGYVFRSLKSAQRYVETREVGRNALKSKDQSNDDEELKDDNISSDGVEKDIAEGLPPGWIKEIKTTKSARKFRKDSYFIDPIKGHVFRSLKSAQRYVETGEVGRKTLKSKDQSNDDEELKDDNISKGIAEGLPPGWIKEIKTTKSARKFRKDSYFIDPIKGQVFRSLKSAQRYVETREVGRNALKSKDQSNDDEEWKDDNISVVVEKDVAEVEKDVAEGLPPGWIKEIKITKSAGKFRKDPYFIDPIKGHVFRSLKSAQRYVETGEVGRNTLKSKSQSNDDEELKDVNISLPSGVKKKKKRKTKKKKITAIERSLEMEKCSKLNKTGKGLESSSFSKPKEKEVTEKTTDDVEEGSDSSAAVELVTKNRLIKDSVKKTPPSSRKVKAQEEEVITPQRASKRLRARLVTD